MKSDGLGTVTDNFSVLTQWAQKPEALLSGGVGEGSPNIFLLHDNPHTGMNECTNLTGTAS